MLIATCASLGSSLVARAESAAVLPHAGDSRLEAARAAAHKAAIEALREQGLTVRALTPRATKNAGELQSDCSQITCAPAVLAAHQIDIAVGIAVWQGESGPQVNVTLVDALGRKYPGYAIIVNDDAAAAARAGLLEARGLQLLGPGPWIHVRGAPSGASVSIDGQAVGVLPYRGSITPGDHELEVRADGYVAKTIPIVVSLEPTTTARVEVELSAAAATTHARTDEAAPHATDYVAGDPALEPVEKASPWNFVIGGILAAGGVALATIEPIQTIAKDGDCAKPSSSARGSDCEERYAVGGETALKMVAGAVLAGAGVAFMIWQPLRVEAEASTEHAVLRAQLSF